MKRRLSAFMFPGSGMLLSSCLTLYTSPLSQVNTPAPREAGQAFAQAGLGLMGGSTPGFVHLWYAPVRSLVVMADANSSHEEASIQTSRRGRTSYQHDIGRGSSYGAGIGYWKATGGEGFCLAAGANTDWRAIVSRRAPLKGAKFDEDKAYEYKVFRPYVQGSYYLAFPAQASKPHYCLINTLRGSLTFPYWHKTANNVLGNGPDPNIRDQFDPEGRQLILQASFQGQMRRNAFVLEGGPLFNLGGDIRNSSVHYTIPKFGIQVSAGVLIGWKKELPPPAEP